MARQLPDDWEERYNIRPVMMESFVQKDRFAGTCYKAANWVNVGQTKGRGKYRTKLVMGAKKKHLLAEEAASNDRLYVNGLPLDISEDEVAKIFSQYGPVVRVKKLRTQPGKHFSVALVSVEGLSSARPRHHDSRCYCY